MLSLVICGWVQIRHFWLHNGPCCGWMCIWWFIRPITAWGWRVAWPAWFLLATGASGQCGTHPTPISGSRSRSRPTSCWERWSRGHHRMHGDAWTGGHSPRRHWTAYWRHACQSRSACSRCRDTSSLGLGDLFRSPQIRRTSRTSRDDRGTCRTPLEWTWWDVVWWVAEAW